MNHRDDRNNFETLRFICMVEQYKKTNKSRIKEQRSKKDCKDVNNGISYGDDSLVGDKNIKRIKTFR